MKKVISIVEDEKDLNELVKRYLEKEGYEVRAYLTYDDAVVHTVDDDVHLWILDIMLDDKSGFDLIEEIRARNPQVPVIFMSARDKEFDRIIGLDALPPQLSEMAKVRLENPELSLADLAMMLTPPIGKSGVNARLRKISEIARKLRSGENLEL